MNWLNLKEERCPRCGAFLSKNSTYYCRFCHFNISFGKAYSLVGHVSLHKLATELLKKHKNKKTKL